MPLPIKIENFLLEQNTDLIHLETVGSTMKEIKRRYKLTAQELDDVAKAIKEVGNQLGDIDDAVKGKARKGRKAK